MKKRTVLPRHTGQSDRMRAKGIGERACDRLLGEKYSSPFLQLCCK